MCKQTTRCSASPIERPQAARAPPVHGPLYIEWRIFRKTFMMMSRFFQGMTWQRLASREIISFRSRSRSTRECRALVRSERFGIGGCPAEGSNSGATTRMDHRDGATSVVRAGVVYIARCAERFTARGGRGAKRDEPSSLVHRGLVLAVLHRIGRGTRLAGVDRARDGTEELRMMTMIS
jgi:hypothetical protein